MRFVALDVETANADRGSICQIGVCLFEDGQETDSFASLINPGCHFDDVNTTIHGITVDAVVTAPSFLAIFGALHAFMRGAVVISHGLFDRQAIAAACARAGVETPDCLWIDSVDLARQAWPAQTNYRLDRLASGLGIEFDHHDALHDARAAGLVALNAMQRIGRPYNEIVQAHGRASNGAEPSPNATSDARRPFTAKKAILARDHLGGDGPLAGQRIVFTGAMSIARDDAARIASALGAHCSDSVSKKTTILVVGDADLPRPHQGTAGGLTFTTSARSGKHAKAEALNDMGAAIRIIGESEFLQMCEAARVEPLSPSAALARAMASGDADAAVSAIIAQAQARNAAQLATLLAERRPFVASAIRMLSSTLNELGLRLGI